MKKVIIPIFIFCIISSFDKKQDVLTDAFTGAWKSNMDNGEIVMMMDNYFVYTKYDLAAKQFFQTWGGPYTISGNKLIIKIEFNYKDNARVGKTTELEAGIDQKRGLMIRGDLNLDMQQIDNGTGALAGNWRIPGRKQGETINEMARGARKTLKMLSGKRFQWMAINTETGSFSGTGGGSYTFENGKYTEHIEFFSRDSTRVGASLSFDGKV